MSNILLDHSSYNLYHNYLMDTCVTIATALQANSDYNYSSIPAPITIAYNFCSRFRFTRCIALGATHSYVVVADI